MTPISQSKEDYLKAIYEAQQTGMSVQRARLAETIGVSSPAVSTALQRLKRDKLVDLSPGGDIDLTPKGRSIAEHLVLRHNLVEKLLYEIIGLEWYKVHEEAERIEHVISEDVEEKLLDLFGKRATTCPHGTPIYGESLDERSARGLHRLSDCEPTGQTVQVALISDRDSSFLRFLDEKGVVPQARIQIVEKEYGDILTIAVGDNPIHLDQHACDRIWIEALVPA